MTRSATCTAVTAAMLSLCIDVPDGRSQAGASMAPLTRSWARLSASTLSALHDGFPYAVAINSRGYNAFVLKYRAGQGATVATQDMAAAISYILGNAASLGVSGIGYSLCSPKGLVGAARMGLAYTSFNRPAASLWSRLEISV